MINEVLSAMKRIAVLMREPFGYVCGCAIARGKFFGSWIMRDLEDF